LNETAVVSLGFGLSPLCLHLFSRFAFLGLTAAKCGECDAQRVVVRIAAGKKCKGKGKLLSNPVTRAEPPNRDWIATDLGGPIRNFHSDLAFLKGARDRERTTMAPALKAQLRHPF
jgi:hypothetical protein